MELGPAAPHTSQHQEYRDDLLQYRLVRRKTLSHETVRISVRVEMLVNAAIQDTAKVRHDINGALQQFIKGAPWQLGTIQRNTASVVGFEQIVVTAVATVPARDNFNLVARASQVSRQGLVLRYPQVDYSLPSHLVDEAVRQLRLETLKIVHDDLIDYEQATGRPWRIGDIRFGMSTHRYDATEKGAHREMGYDENFAYDPEPEAGSAECIKLTTEVCLRSDQLADPMWGQYCVK